jgi:hypothetical protein
MFPTILPLRAVLLQFLILWLTIAIESWFFQRLLKISPRISVEYAAVINLFSTCLGWLFFFIGNSYISQNQRELLIGYILLGQTQPIYISLILAVFIIYIGSFLIKLKGLELLKFLARTDDQQSLKPARFTGDLINRLPPQNPQKLTQFYASLIAHTCSYFLMIICIYL